MTFKDAKITERAHSILKLIARNGGHTFYGAVEVAAEHYAKHKKILLPADVEAEKAKKE